MRINDLKMPAWMRKMNTLPEDPENSVVYGYEVPNAGCFVIAYPIPKEHSLAVDGKQAVIDGIHRTLQDNQGLIEVEEGKTAAGHPYLYSIVKTLKESIGVQYGLTLHMDYPDGTVHVQGTFDELGVTGSRDALVYAMLSNQGLVKATENGIEGWNEDPYDPEYRKGNRMNCSEKREYDKAFPQHPLSVARQFTAELIGMN